MDIDQLTTFERAVREGSFSRAALALGIGQPAVSSRILALEEAVGGALFARGRHIALTALGESFLPYVRRALEVLGQGVDAARLVQVGRRGRIRLGALGSLAGGLVGPALARFIRAHPDVECVLRSGDHERLVEQLLDGIVELALVAWPCKEAVTADFVPLFVFHEPVVLVAHPKHELAVRRRVTEDELTRLARPLLRLRWWQTHHPEISRLVERSGTSVDVAMETARDLLLNGVGAGFFTRTYVADDLARGALAEVKVRGLSRVYRDSALVRRSRSMRLSAAAADLVQAIREQAERLQRAAPAGAAPGPVRASSWAGTGTPARRASPSRPPRPRRSASRRRRAGSG